MTDFYASYFSCCVPRANVLFLWIIAMAYANAYPNIVRCNTNLDSSEIMMGHNIIEYKDADIKVHLEVKADGDDQWTSGDIYRLRKSNSSELQVRLGLPESLKNDPFDTTMFVLETTQGAKFVRGTCEGRRAFGMEASNELKLSIEDPFDTIFLWGAWAHGYEPVKLTAKFQLSSLQEDEL